MGNWTAVILVGIGAALWIKSREQKVVPPAVEGFGGSWSGRYIERPRFY